MIKLNQILYLASSSPRRKQLLKQIGLRFKSIHTDIDEVISEKDKPVSVVKRLAEDKLNAAISKLSSGIIIAADTIVVLNGKIIGKPNNKSDAKRILKTLSGKTHSVYTGFALYNFYNSRKIVDYEKTGVTFRDITEKEINFYIATGSPLDKAGAYGIQDFGAVFVKKINGCFYNVMGLPISKIFSDLRTIAET